MDFLFSGQKNRQAICASINESNTIQEQFPIPSIAKPRAMAIQQNNIWICGENLTKIHS